MNDSQYIQYTDQPDLLTTCIFTSTWKARKNSQLEPLLTEENMSLYRHKLSQHVELISTEQGEI